MTRLMQYLREQAALPPHLRDPLPPEPTPEDLAARAADLARRIDDDISAGREAMIEDICRATVHPSGLVVGRPCISEMQAMGDVELASLHRRLVPRVADDGVIRFPRCMLDAAGLEEMDA